MADCFHCGLPVPDAGGRRIFVLGVERDLCCAGCEAVAGTIVAAGLESYYQTRAGPVPLPEPLRKTDFTGTEASLVLEGVRCSACLWLIEEALRRAPGVTGVEVNYAARRARVAWSGTTLDAILQAVRAVGYAAYPYDPQIQDAVRKKERRQAQWRLFVAGFGAMQVMMYAFPAYVDEVSPDALQLMRWASLFITTPVLLISCRPFFAGALAELRNARLGLDTPIALGLGFGYAASTWATITGAGEVYFDSISMLAFLLLGARWLESAARERAARMLDPLLRWQSAATARAGEELLVPAGERIAADGIVIDGRSSADESLLTGESRPVAKTPGDEVFAGAVNLEQPIRIRVTRAGADTRAAAIARLAERGVASRPRIVEAADLAARHLTGVIVAVALLAGFVSRDPWIAIAVLVVACPCALALASPILLTRASGTLLARGVLLTRARALDALARVTDVVLDKTGTLTTGRLTLARVTPLGAASAEECLDLARALEATSRHPVARAFPGASALDVESPQNVPAQGIEARMDGRRVRMGSEAFCQALCGVPPAGPAHPGFDASFVFLADEGGWLAAFELEDALRPEAARLVARLREAGLAVHLATGDRAGVGAALARALWIDNCAGEMKPEDKYRYVEALQRQGRVVAMVGDGLNDAPVLARADVSFAMGCGADAAQLRADVVLTTSSLDGIPVTMEVARRTMRLVRQNIGWALAYNAVALPLAAAGWIGPWEAALAMGASSLTVALNALRPLQPEPKWKASTSSYPSRSPSYS